jgi:hypothetical protein
MINALRVSFPLSVSLPKSYFARDDCLWSSISHRPSQGSRSAKDSVGQLRGGGGESVVT